MIVISDDLVLAPSSSQADFNANNPLIGWHNLVRTTNVSASSAGTLTPAINAANPYTHLRWVGLDNGLEQWLRADIGAEVDYVGLARHNLGTLRRPVILQGYRDLDMSSQPIWFPLSTETMFADDGILLFRFTLQHLAGVRAKIAAGAGAPAVAVMYVGRLLVLQRRIYVGHTPISYGRVVESLAGTSESGNFLGRVILGEGAASAISLQNLTPSWYRANLDPFVAVCQQTPFFFAWRPERYPSEIGYVWVAPGANPQPSNQRVNGMMSIEFPIRGLIR